MTDNLTTERVDHPSRVRGAIDELMREKDAIDNRTTELREKLREHDVEYEPTKFSSLQTTFIANGIEWIVTEREATGELFVEPRHGLTPEQAIAATLGNNMQMQPRCVDCGTLLSDELRCTLCAEKLNAKLVSDRDAIYNAGFDNGVKATLQQLEGLIARGDDLADIEAWIDEQWKEYES